MNKWEEKFPVDDIVYYIVSRGNGKWEIEWGTVDSHYYDALCIQRYHVKDTRLVNGVPYKDFVPDERRQKLPKGWEYNTMLYHPEVEQLGNVRFDITDTECLKKLIEDKYFIKNSEYDFSHIESDITKEGWRLRKAYYTGQYIPSDFISMPYSKCFDNFDDAKKVKEGYEAEFMRQVELSDYDWAVEQMDNTLNRAIAVNLITEDDAEKIKEQLLKENIEDIETRIHMGQIQWKLWKNKKWITVAY